MMRLRDFTRVAFKYWPFRITDTQFDFVFQLTPSYTIVKEIKTLFYLENYDIFVKQEKKSTTTLNICLEIRKNSDFHDCSQKNADNIINDQNSYPRIIYEWSVRRVCDTSTI